MTLEKAAAFHLVTTGFEGRVFIDSSGQISLVIFFQNLNSYVFAVIFNDVKNERSISRFFVHILLDLLYWLVWLR